MGSLFGSGRVQEALQECCGESYAYAYDDTLVAHDYDGWYYSLEEYQDAHGTDPNFVYTLDSDLDIIKADKFYKPEDHTVSIGLSFSF